MQDYSDKKRENKEEKTKKLLPSQQRKPTKKIARVLYKSFKRRKN